MGKQVTVRQKKATFYQNRKQHTRPQNRPHWKDRDTSQVNNYIPSQRI